MAAPSAPAISAPERAVALPRPRAVTVSAILGILLAAGFLVLDLSVISLLDDAWLSPEERRVLIVVQVLVGALSAVGLVAGFATLRGAGWGRRGLLACYALAGAPMLLGLLKHLWTRLDHGLPLLTSGAVVIATPLSLCVAGIVLLSTPRARAWSASLRR